jgi:hypothetical protein
LKSNLRQDVRSIMAWGAFGPALATWPFVSALPVVSLLAGPNTANHITTQVVLLATGFWGAGIGAAMLWTKLNLQQPSGLQVSPPATLSQGLGLPLAAYATVWTAIYGFVMYYL